jgi:type II secretory pathway pseudopilin PulG
MSGAKSQMGFTIVEVTLFVAISALMVSTLVFGVQRMIGRVRFNDSLNDLTAYIQQQYENVRDGVNPTSGTMQTFVSGNQVNCQLVNGTKESASDQFSGKSDCFLYGKILHFPTSTNEEKSKIVASYLVGDKADPGDSLSDVKFLVSGNNSIATYQTQWQEPIYEILSSDLNNSNGVAGANSIVISRNPNSSQLIVRLFNDGATSTSGANYPALDTVKYVSTALTGGQDTSYIAIILQNQESSGSKYGAVCIAPGSTSDAVFAKQPVDQNATAETICGAS